MRTILCKRGPTRISVQRPITCVNTVVVDLCFLSNKVCISSEARRLYNYIAHILHVQAVLAYYQECILSIRSDALLVVYYQASGCNHGTILYVYYTGFQICGSSIAYGKFL